MILYHGSPIGGLTHLNPFLSEHGKPYIYFASNPLVALLYAVKPVPKPFGFYPYGFDAGGKVVYSEYYEDAFCLTYKGKKGWLYECSGLQNLENPTQINCAYTCTEAVKIDNVTEIPDIYKYYMEQKEQGHFRVKTLQEVSEKELGYAHGYLIKMMTQYELKKKPEHPMSCFIREHFPEIWN